MAKTIAYDTHFNYGTGVDSSVEQLRGVAVIPTPPRNLTGAAGAEVTYSIRLVESQRQLEESLGVSAAMSLSYGFVAGGNARVDFAQDHAMTENSVCATVRVVVKNPVLLMSEVRLTAEAKDLYARSPEAFKTRYGDSFVNGILTGGELLGLIMMRASSTSEKADISASVRASGMIGLWSGSLDVEVKQQAREATKNTDTAVFIHTSGYVPDRYPNTVDGLLTLASEFPGRVRQGQGTPYAMDLIEYRFLDLPDGPNLFDLQNRDEIIRYAAGKKAEAISKRATVRFIREHIEQYPTADERALVQYEAQINSVLDTIQRKISACFNDYRQCSYGANDLVLPAFEFPEPRPGRTPMKTPHFISMPLEAATAVAESVGLRLVDQSPSVITAGNSPEQLALLAMRMIFRQEPPPDTPIMPGATVKVSRQP
jgi:hypothetical protein